MTRMTLSQVVDEIEHVPAKLAEMEAMTEVVTRNGTTYDIHAFVGKPQIRRISPGLGPGWRIDWDFETNE